MAHLISSRRFWPLLFTQFLGAFNDNLFKNALLTLVALKMADQAHVLANVIAGVFILPFFLFSATAGELADKLPRHKIARFLKLLEIVLMLGVACAYAWGNLPLLVVIMALMGMQSAFFGPVKYALLPQQLAPEELIGGNAYIEATTYLAILLGLILGTLLPIEISIGVLIGLAVCGYACARQILPAPAPRPNLVMRKNLLRAIYANYRFLKRQRPIFQSVLGATWFWMIGALVAVQIYPLCSQILNADETVMSFFLVLFSLGVALGSFGCSRLLKGEINTVYVPISAVGMALSLLFLWLLSADYPTPEKMIGLGQFWAAPHALGLSANLLVLAFWGGLYIVPLNAFMQNRAPKAYTASIIAGNNIFNALGMTLSAVFAVVLFQLGLSLPQLFLVMAGISLVVAVYICALLPDALVRSILQTLLRLMFRTQVHGLSNFKRAGSKVVIIANHTSLWDGVLMAAFMPERITFAINTEWTRKWFMPIIRAAADFYPVDANNPLSVRKLIEEVKKGRKVVIFPEGRISLTGKIMQVYDGAAMVAARAGAKLLPVRINGAQYSSLSYVTDKFKSRSFPKIDIHIMPAGKFDLPVSKEQRGQTAQRLYRLMTEMVYKTSPASADLFSALLNSAERHGRGRIVGLEISGRRLRYRRLIRRAVGMAEALRSTLGGCKQVGVCLNNGFAFWEVFFALQYLGKSVVIGSAADGAQMVENGVNVCVSDDTMAAVDGLTIVRLKNVKSGRLVTWIKSAANGKLQISGFKNGQMVTTSAAEILENVRRLDTVLPFDCTDTALNCLPASQIDGLVLGYLLPLFSGTKTCFWEKRHAKFMPRVLYDLSATILFGDAEVYNAAVKEASVFDFFNIKTAFVIGDKMSETALTLWLKKFGVRLLENYTPENSMLIAAINTRLYYRFGGQGCPLPGVELPVDEEGFVKLA